MYSVPNKFPTTIVGSYPKFPAAQEAIKRRKAGEIGEEEFRELVKPAIREAVEDHLWAGVDIISDGEQAREDMVVYFAERMRGYEIGDWVRIFDNEYFRKPVVVGKVEWVSPMTLDHWKYASSISQGRPVTVSYTHL
ncbi:MAG: methylcobamide--CoM methyltransferase, partial [Acidilobaceae archaeon]|nr:methylcobamide--CoM methyltransferase [Acidilobaceae archaeon]